MSILSFVDSANTMFCKEMWAFWTLIQNIERTLAWRNAGSLPAMNSVNTSSITYRERVEHYRRRKLFILCRYSGEYSSMRTPFIVMIGTVSYLVYDSGNWQSSLGNSHCFPWELWMAEIMKRKILKRISTFTSLHLVMSLLNVTFYHLKQMYDWNLNRMVHSFLTTLLRSLFFTLLIAMKSPWDVYLQTLTFLEFCIFNYFPSFHKRIVAKLQLSEILRSLNLLKFGAEYDCLD